MKWYEKAYRRNVIDMHITDWDDRFLSEFDAEKYVEMLVLSQAQSAVVYGHSHVGHCYYPTKVGHMHRGLKGRNIFGEVVDACHRNGIAVVAYYSLIFDDWAYRQNPDWRIRRRDGSGVADHSRYGVCCPNSPYREYIAAHAGEMCEQFEFEGLRFDMTFWPNVCYCPHCQRRYEEEVGEQLPYVINWEDPRWVGFQRKREEWLTDFASLATSTVKAIRPQISVEHQASTYAAPWWRGVTVKMARQNTFLQGDFYGDAVQGSFVRKLLRNMSENLPIGFETSICVSIRNHTAKKTKELLETKAHAALADAAAFIFIDGIDPVGTLNRSIYERMRDVLSKSKLYEPYVGGDLCQDVAVYLSTASKCDFADNGKTVDDPTLSTRTPHVDAALSVCKSLTDNHIPFGVICKKNLGELSRHKILVLPDVLMLDEEEAEAVREYVRSGGSLYASKHTSLITSEGVKKVDFLLSEVFGVSYVGETKERYTYIAPEEGSEDLFAGYTQKHPLALDSSQMVVRAESCGMVLGRTVLPYSDPDDPRRYVSIHSNPPGIRTDDPAVAVNRFGEGKSVYVTGELEKDDSHRDIFISLIRLLGDRFSFEADAPTSVEVTLFHQEENRRYVISLINFQKELPNIPVQGIVVRVKLDDKVAKTLMVLPEERQLDYEVSEGYVEFTVPRLETFAMFALDYE